MRCKICGSFVIFASSNGKKLKIVDEKIDVDYEEAMLNDFNGFECGSCSSSEIEGIDSFLEKIKGEKFSIFGNRNAE